MFIVWMTLGAAIGFMLCAMLTAGKIADLQEDAQFWRQGYFDLLESWREAAASKGAE